MEVHIIVEKTKVEELIQYLNSESTCDQKDEVDIIFDETKQMLIFTDPDRFHKSFKYLLSEKLEYMTISIFNYDQTLFENIFLRRTRLYL